jgi:chromosome segregation ATPase
MTPQEILASLSKLEQELQSIKSARLLAEDTIKSYKDVQKEIRSFFSDFQNVTSSLNTVATALDEGKVSLSADAQKSIAVMKAQLETLNSAFANQCSAAVLHFVESVNQSASDLKQTTEHLTNEYAKNNKSLKGHIDELSKLQSSLIAASDSIVSLKEDIAELQAELKSSQENQDNSLEKIASDLRIANDSQTTILNHLSDDLKSSQKSQDNDLLDIKGKVAKLSQSQPKHAAKTDTAIRNIASAKASIEEELSAIESQISDVDRTVSSIKTVCVVIIVAIIVILLVILGK